MYSGWSLAQNVSHPKKVFDPTYALVAFQLSISTNFRDIRGPKNTVGGPVPLTRSLAEKNSHPKSVLGPSLQESS